MERNDSKMPDKCIYYNLPNNRVGLWDCVESPTQRWNYDDSKLIPLLDTNKCLKFDDNKKATLGTKSDCATFTYDGTNFKSSPTTCLNLPGRNYAFDSDIDNIKCTDAQPDTIKWIVRSDIRQTPAQPSTQFSNKFIRAKLQGDPGNKCLYYSPDNPVKVGSWECTDHPTQRWNFDGSKLISKYDETKCVKFDATTKIAGVGSLTTNDCTPLTYNDNKFKDANNTCLNVAGGVTYSGAPVDRFSCTEARQDTVTWNVVDKV
jgi:hypothetical protein